MCLWSSIPRNMYSALLKTMTLPFQPNVHREDSVGPDTKPGLVLCVVEKDWVV